MRFVPALLLLPLVTPLLACSSASSGEVGGVPRFSFTAPSSTAACAGDPSADAGAGHDFADLYRDYFGPAARSSCAGSSGNCHGSAASIGASASSFVCPPSPLDCWTGMKTAGLTGPDLLPSVLRHCDGSGAMPKAPADFVFYAADLKRIDDWLSAGGPKPSE